MKRLGKDFLDGREKSNEGPGMRNSMMRTEATYSSRLLDCQV